MTGRSARAPPRLDKIAHVFLTPGTLYCGVGPAVVSTVLGSCVAVCLVDRHHRATGINHFVLPRSTAGEHSLRFGDVAIERLWERMSRFGCAPKDLRAKVFGGAAVLPFGDTEDTVGTKNVRIAIDWLRRHDIPVVARRTGGKNGLLIRLHTATGRVLVRKIASGAGVDLSGRVPSHDSRLGASVDEEI
jgi:chemotaxis protein CheD